MTTDNFDVTKPLQLSRFYVLQDVTCVCYSGPTIQRVTERAR